MLNRTRSIAIAMAFLATACSDGMDPDLTRTGDGVMNAESGAERVVVMTRNLYVGADVDAVIAALASPDPLDDIAALQTAVQELSQTDWPTRAKALAGEIARERPHAVGLQEVSKIDLDLTPLGMPVIYHADFLPTLLAELSARGLNYTVAAKIKNIVAKPLPGVSLVDWDVMLIDANRVHVTGIPVAKNFTYNIGIVAPGVNLVRGFVRVDATVGGKAYTFVSTHLESGGQPGLDQLRAAQMTEIAAYLPATGPVIVLGDLNDKPGSLMYQVAQGAGLTDVWAALYPAEPGLSCCHKSDLSNERANLRSRIDYIWARDVGHPEEGVAGRMKRLGLLPRERIAGPFHKIWPSDHAGLAASLVTPPALGER